jgi:hypothetical protein
MDPLYFRENESKVRMRLSLFMVVGSAGGRGMPPCSRNLKEISARTPDAV